MPRTPRKDEMPMPDQLHLVRDVLDKLVVDGAEHTPMGRADGVVLVIESGSARVARIEVGTTLLAARLSTRLGRWVRRIAKRYGLRRGSPTRIVWSKVRSVGTELVISTSAQRSPALVWERWLRQHVIRYIPVFKREKSK